MRTGFYECYEHNRKNRKKAIEEMPYASKIIAVVGGYLGFESWDDYEIWKNQKQSNQNKTIKWITHFQGSTLCTALSSSSFIY